MEGLDRIREELSSHNWDDRLLLNTVDTVLRRLYRHWPELDAGARTRVDQLRKAAATAAGDSGISAPQRRTVLVKFLDDLAAIDAALPIVSEAMRRGKASAPYAIERGISYLQAVNLLRVLRDEPSNYVLRAANLPPRHSPAPAADTATGPGQAQGNARPANPRAADPQPRPPTRPSEPAATPSTDTVRGGVTVPYFTYVDFPQEISNNTDAVHPLVVQLVRQRPQESRGESEVNISFTEEVELVDVVVRAPGFVEVSGHGPAERDGPALRRTIAIPQTTDSQPAVFLLQLVENSTGPHWVTVDFYHRNRNVGSLTLEVDVRAFRLRRNRSRPTATATDDDAAPPVFGTASVVRALDGVSIPQGTPLPAADVELRIIRDADGRTLHFHIHSQKLPAWDGRAVGSIVFNDLSRPDAFFDRLVERLSAFATRAGADLNAHEADRLEYEIAEIGIELYEQLFPDPLRMLYWELKRLREAGKLKNLLIVSDEPWIPWELVKPYDEVDGLDVEDDHLAGAWQMSRWLSGVAAPSDLNIRSARLVVPKLDLDFVRNEIKYFDSLAKRDIDIAAPVTTREEFLNLAQKGGAQLFHFATHGNFNQASVDESPIALQGDPLFPSDLTRRRATGLRRERPLIFLNTCHGARVGFNLTGLGGWAQRLVNQLGVTAFVGALWEVNDELASKFSQAFYEELWAGKTLGEAFFSARQQIRAMQSANPTWLAYTLYGDPNSRILWKAADSPTTKG